MFFLLCRWLSSWSLSKDVWRWHSCLWNRISRLSQYTEPWHRRKGMLYSLHSKPTGSATNLEINCWRKLTFWRWNDRVATAQRIILCLKYLYCLWYNILAAVQFEFNYFRLLRIVYSKFLVNVFPFLSVTAENLVGCSFFQTGKTCDL